MANSTLGRVDFRAEVERNWGGAKLGAKNENAAEFSNSAVR